MTRRSHPPLLATAGMLALLLSPHTLPALASPDPAVMQQAAPAPSAVAPQTMPNSASLAPLAKNETLQVRLLSPINTSTAHPGDTFSSSVVLPERFRDGIVLGRITRVDRPQRGVGKPKAEIQFGFESLTFGGRTEKIAATLADVENSRGVKNVDEEGRVIAKGNHKRAASTLLGAGAGAILGGIRGGGQGAAIGAAAGGAAGYLIGLTMTASSTDIQFNPGSIFTLHIEDVPKAR